MFYEKRSKETAKSRIELVTSTLGYHLPKVSMIAELNSSTGKELGEPPLANNLVPPVRNFFNSNRKSYGTFIGPQAGAFSNSYHVGEDVAWHKDMQAVVAIGDGIVRAAFIGAESWGGLVVIEHRDENQEYFCSLYAHLGICIPVREGDEVKQGQYIGALGRTYTWYNGGYGTHLHFGIHKGRFVPKRSKDTANWSVIQSNWISGYISEKQFKEQNHGWQDPQTFIKNNLNKNF